MTFATGLVLGFVGGWWAFAVLTHGALRGWWR